MYVEIVNLYEKMLIKLLLNNLLQEILPLSQITRCLSFDLSQTFLTSTESIECYINSISNKCTIRTYLIVYLSKLV